VLRARMAVFRLAPETIAKIIEEFFGVAMIELILCPPGPIAFHSSALEESGKLESKTIKTIVRIVFATFVMNLASNIIVALEPLTALIEPSWSLDKFSCTFLIPVT
jgi:hypothetical protein